MTLPTAGTTSSSSTTAPSSAGGPITTSESTAATNKKQEGSLISHVWEETDSTRMWEHVVEDAEGNLVVSGIGSDSLADAIRKRRKRLERNDYAQKSKRVIRDMIRYLYILLDASRWMRQKDPVLTPGTKLDVAVYLLLDFVQEYYDQNPLSHLGFVLLVNGEAEILSPLSTSSKTHKLALQSVLQMAATEAGPNSGGEFSLQNGLEVAGRSLGHQPKHGSREILVITSALSSCDPGSILSDTIPKLLHSKIRVSTFALTAELHICRKIAEETAGSMGVCLDKTHFRDWMHGQCVPPPTLKKKDLHGDNQDEETTTAVLCEMIAMGFPTRTSSEVPSLVHATRDKTILARTAYTCPQCQAKNLELPTDCAVCGLKLVLAPHLARSFHHLFPVSSFVERPVAVTNNDKDMSGALAPVSSTNPISSSAVPVVTSSSNSQSIAAYYSLDSKLLVTSRDDERCCYSCLRNLGWMDDATTSAKKNIRTEELLRFQCPDCLNYFCVECDAYLHDTLHNCPGCLCLL